MACMNRIYYFLFLLLFALPAAVPAQSIKFSGYDREDTRDMDFEIIGKMNNKILVYKNIRTNHKISIYDQDMNTLETVKLGFVPDKTYNMDFVIYPDFFYIIYQYQQQRIVHCMVVKMDANAKKMSEPVEVDTTQIPVMSDNKIYSTISSEDKQRILIFKVQARNQKFGLSTLLFDNNMKLLDKSREAIRFDEGNERYDNFALDNLGNFVFTYTSQSGNRGNSNALGLITKEALQNTFVFQEIDLAKEFIDEVKLKIDNLNNRYIINSLYYQKNRGSIEGLFTYIWDNANKKTHVSNFTEFDGVLRADAKRDGALQYAFDDFVIRQVVVKKDGGFILAAEDFTNDLRESSSSPSRYNYLNNPNSVNSGYYYYNPYGSSYRPFNSTFYGSTRFYCENIMVLNISKEGKTEWSRIIQKEQFGDNEVNFLSFSSMISSGEMHFLYNNNNKNEVITDQSLSKDGTLKRNPTLKSPERAHEFMPRLSKQVGANQLIIPCAYRNNICFAKIDF